MVENRIIEAGADIFKALAHPTRLLIVERLGRETEMCVCEITELVGNDMSTISRHLSILRNAGIVDRDKRGLQVYYRLAIPCVLNFISCVENVIDARATALPPKLYADGVQVSG